MRDPGTYVPGYSRLVRERIRTQYVLCVEVPEINRNKEIVKYTTGRPNILRRDVPPPRGYTSGRDMKTVAIGSPSTLNDTGPLS